MKVTIDEVKTIAEGGKFYDITGSLENGRVVAEVALGEVSANLYRITRRIRSINRETNRMYCECGRVFLIDKDLSFVECPY